MNDFRLTRQLCECAEIGEDGTRSHIGKRVLMRMRADRANEGIPACRNHAPGYKRFGWVFIRKAGRIRVWKWDGSA